VGPAARGAPFSIHLWVDRGPRDAGFPDRGRGAGPPRRAVHGRTSGARRGGADADECHDWHGGAGHRYAPSQSVRSLGGTPHGNAAKRPATGTAHVSPLRCPWGSKDIAVLFQRGWLGRVFHSKTSSRAQRHDGSSSELLAYKERKKEKRHHGPRGAGCHDKKTKQKTRRRAT